MDEIRTSPQWSSGFRSLRILTVLTHRERELFFSTAVWNQLTRLVQDHDHRVITPPGSDTEWASLLNEFCPEVIIGGWAMPRVAETYFQKRPSLQYFCYLTGSVRSKLPRLFFEQGGTASNWGGVISRTVAECGLMLALGCLRQVPRFYRQMQIEKGWRNGSPVPVPRSLFGRRVGIHGYGNVVRELIRLLEPFSCRVTVFSAPVEPSQIETAGIQAAPSLKELFAANEIIFEAEGLTEQSRQSVDAEVLKCLRPGSVFVNIGRGAVVDEAALLARARKGDISIGLDVYENEPLSAQSPLRDLDDAILLPHMAGPTEDHYHLCGAAAMDNFEAWLKHQPLPHAFTISHYDRST